MSVGHNDGSELVFTGVQEVLICDFLSQSYF